MQEYLQRWKKTLVVVSHDRDFLNMVTTDIIHLHDERLHAYRGNFAQFEEMYEQRRREVNKVAEKFEKQMKVAKKSGSKANQDKASLLSQKNSKAAILINCRRHRHLACKIVHAKKNQGRAEAEILHFLARHRSSSE